MSAQTYIGIAASIFEHIKHGDSCPLTPHVITQTLRDSRAYVDQSSISLRLAQCLDEAHGTEEIVQNRRKVIINLGDIEIPDNNVYLFRGGSRGDGFRMKTSDIDLMAVIVSVMVTHMDQTDFLLGDCGNKTILLMREDGCRPGYTHLEICKEGVVMERHVVFRKAIVTVGESRFLSSDIYRHENVEDFSTELRAEHVSNGPCLSILSQSLGLNYDIAIAFPCVCWPREANEWKHRTRIYGWPSQTMIDKIIQGGCHLVPVGDKCSADTLLQWRISFACAEQLLVHSLTHPQFRVYGLLKYFLSQIKDLLQHITGDSDILCSYFIKTAIFYAVENSPQSLWDDKNTFTCFRFCLSIIIAWVKSGYCPNYFIQTNNMFLRKVHGEKRQKLLHFLIDLYYLNWMCLSVKSSNVPYICKMLQQQPSITTRHHSEYLRDLDLFQQCFALILVGTDNDSLYPSIKRLLGSKTDVDEIIAYYALNTTLCIKACSLFEEYTTAGNNKQKYLALKKCEQLLVRQSEMCTSPGLLLLATFHYLTDNYIKAIEICSELMSTFKLFLDEWSIPTEKSIEQYKRLYCGRDFTLHHKLKKCVYTCFLLQRCKAGTTLCLPHLMLEATKHPLGVYIPPQAYATFLCFLCYHELGDRRRRDTELINLRALNYDPVQGGHRYWIVHTLLGVCYQTVGDKRRAIRSFTDSLRVMPEYNPALERIDALRNSRQT